jgi:chromosome segregation ATPase
VTYPDFAEALQARICADLEAEKIAHTPRKRREADEQRRDEMLKVRTAALEQAVAKAEILDEQRRQEAETAAKKIAELEARIATLQQMIVKTEAIGEQQRQELQTAAKRVDHLVVELVEITGEFVEMSKRVTEQTAAMDKLRAELDYYRPRS